MSLHRHDQLYAIVQSARDLLREQEPGIPSSELPHDKWSNHEILGHLIDSAYNNHRRIVQAIGQNDLIFDGYDQDLWVKANGYRHRPWSDLVTTWLVVNLHLAKAISAIPQDKLTHLTKTHNYHLIGFRKVQEGLQVTLDMLIEDYMAHLIHHLLQLIPTYKSPIGV